jgi:hypothetical protein
MKQTKLVLAIISSILLIGAISMMRSRDATPDLAVETTKFDPIAAASSAIGEQGDVSLQDANLQNEMLDDVVHGPELLVPVSEPVASALQPWFEEVKQTQKVGDPISIVEFLSFSDDLLTSLRYANERRFRFQMNSEFDFEISVDDVYEYDGGWVLHGHIIHKPDASSVRIFVEDDGTKSGSLFIRGVGRLFIEPTPQLPIHAVHLRTGSYRID